MSIKRYVVAAGAAALVFSGAYGAAASLGINNDPVVQVGSTDLVCDSNGVDLNVAKYFLQSSQVAKFEVSGIDEACFGEQLTLLTFDSSAPFAAFTSSTRVTVDASSEVINIPDTSAADIAKVELHLVTPSSF